MSAMTRRAVFACCTQHFRYCMSFTLNSLRCALNTSLFCSPLRNGIDYKPLSNFNLKCENKCRSWSQWNTVIMECTDMWYRRPVSFKKCSWTCVLGSRRMHARTCHESLSRCAGKLPRRGDLPAHSQSWPGKHRTAGRGAPCQCEMGLADFLGMAI